MSSSDEEASSIAALVHQSLRDRAATLAVAESLTGGLLGGALTAPAGSSATFRGGVVAYATDLKSALLRVDTQLLERHGAVHPEVAAAMARGVARLLGATFGLATTGVAGPDPQDGRGPGEVHVALAGPAGVRARSLALHGGRDAIRRQTVLQALRLAVEALAAGGNTDS